jgi:hypothetical protein
MDDRGAATSIALLLDYNLQLIRKADEQTLAGLMVATALGAYASSPTAATSGITFVA